MVINPHTMGFRLTNLSEFPNNGVDGHKPHIILCLIYRIHIVYNLISILYIIYLYIYYIVYIYIFCITLYIYICISSHSVSHCWPIPPRIPCSQLAQLQRGAAQWGIEVLVFPPLGVNGAPAGCCLAHAPQHGWRMWDSTHLGSLGSLCCFLLVFRSSKKDSQVKQSLES